MVASEPPLFSEGMSTPFLETLAARPVDPDAPEDTAPLPEEKVHGVGRLLIGLGLVVVGVAVEWLFLAPLGDLDGIIKVPAVLAGVAALAEVLRQTGRVRANEIRLYDHAGELLYEAPPSSYKAGRYAPEWYASLVTPAMKATVIASEISNIIPGWRARSSPTAPVRKGRPPQT